MANFKIFDSYDSLPCEGDPRVLYVIRNSETDKYEIFQWIVEAANYEELVDSNHNAVLYILIENLKKRLLTNPNIRQIIRDEIVDEDNNMNYEMCMDIIESALSEYQKRYVENPIIPNKASETTNKKITEDMVKAHNILVVECIDASSPHSDEFKGFVESDDVRLVKHKLYLFDVSQPNILHYGKPHVQDFYNLDGSYLGKFFLSRFKIIRKLNLTDFYTFKCIYE